MFFIRKYSSVPFGTAIVVINNELLSSVTIAFFFSEEYQSHLKKNYIALCAKVSTPRIHPQRWQCLL